MDSSSGVRADEDDAVARAAAAATTATATASATAPSPSMSGDAETTSAVDSAQLYGADDAVVAAAAAASENGSTAAADAAAQVEVSEVALDVAGHGGIVPGLDDVKTHIGIIRQQSSDTALHVHMGAVAEGDAAAQERSGMEVVVDVAAGVAAVADQTAVVAAALPFVQTPDTNAVTTPTSLTRGSNGSNVSAVYRWYDIEEGLSARRREESSIAKCKLCKQEGKLERRACVRFSKSVTSNLWRHLKENHPQVYARHAGEKKSVQMHRVVGAKKRGRKKKVADADDHHEDHDHDDDQLEEGATAASRKRNKKGKRVDAFFQDYLLTGVATPNGTTTVPSALNIQKRNAMGGATVSLEKLREAIGYLCLYELLPLDVFSSSAFRSLMIECAGGVGGLLDEQACSAVGRKEVVLDYIKKMIPEVKERITMQMKMTDFAHLTISEWSVDSTAPRYQALCAIGLDQEFNPFRRCLQVVSSSPSLRTDESVKKALEKIVPCKYMPLILVVEPHHASDYQALCSERKLEYVESVTSCLRSIMLSTIYDLRMSENFCLGGSLFASGTEQIPNQRLDEGEYISFSPTSVPTSDEFFEFPEAETATEVLEDLTTRLTGHIHRDLMYKAMHFVAHMKRSSRTRKAIKKIALEEIGMSLDTYERVFEVALKEVVVSMGSIYHVLSLAVKMMEPLRRYFLQHKDSTSDFSKLIQLATFSQSDWARLVFLKTILRPFADAAAKLDAERYVTASLLVPSIYTLLEKLRESRPNSAELQDADRTFSSSALPDDIAALRDLAYTNLLSCFGYLFASPTAEWGERKRNTFNILWSATLLDPRTRPFIIKGPLSQLEFWDLVKMEAANIAGQKMKDKNVVHDVGDSGMVSDDEHGDDDGRNRDLWDDLQANLTSCAQEEMLLSSSKSTLELSKSSNLLEVEISFFQEERGISLRANPLEWWQNMRIKYPFLARLARYVLSIPGSVQIEDNPVAANCGLVQAARPCMESSELCDILCASMNLRTEKNPIYEASNKQMWTTV
ncbi:TPA: hypothetical protein N0F65_004897 [Lagenidium giganteum]|uniref:HAT C-terminal dimerisation domain-containing protein n=1 Tax=Lagenidium giganteum TaxID=4803 RepID=A0AAV2YLM5_9STRA|nr:TPA: hypothetical protein N0F65_004897 [Lagenidium giganteum]